MSKIYHDNQRKLQDHFDSRRLADRIEQTLHRSELTADNISFISTVPMFFLTTIDERGFPTCSYKGGAPGFVKVLDSKTIIFPSYNGNGMFLSTGNLISNDKVGLLFINFENPNRIRVHGKASIDMKDPMLQDYHGAELIVRVSVQEVFPNCPRYIHKHQMTTLSEFVPSETGEAPEPRWKSMDWAKDVLPKK